MDNSRQIIASTSRMEAYSDAIIAIIMTLMVFDIKVPTMDSHDSASMTRALLQMAPHFLIFLLSFVTLAVIWVNHHHFFHPIEGVDKILLWLNNYLMLWICFIPFATNLLGKNPEAPVAAALYGFVMFMMAKAFCMVIYYTLFHTNLIPSAATCESLKKQFQRSLVGPVLYLLATATAFVNPNISLFLFVLILAFYFLPKKLVD